MDDTAYAPKAIYLLKIVEIQEKLQKKTKNF